MISAMPNKNGIRSNEKRLTYSKLDRGEVELSSNVIAKAKTASRKFSSLPVLNPETEIPDSVPLCLLSTVHASSY